MNNPQQEKKSETLTSKINAWVGIISVLTTLILSVVTFSINTQRQQAEDAQKELKQQLDAKNQELQLKLEEKKFQKEQYELVSKILPDLLKANPSDEKTITININLIRLILGDKDSEKLFVGLALSTNPNYKLIGKSGTNEIKEQKKRSEQALELENKGFEFLIDGKDEEAIKAFSEAEKIYPQFHSVFEISELLKRNKSELLDVNKRKLLFQQIVNRYQVPQQYLSKLQNISS